MKSDTRQQQILDLAGRQGFVSIDGLSRQFEVTPQTIRRDINQLCEQGLPIVATEVDGYRVSLRREPLVSPNSVLTDRELEILTVIGPDGRMNEHAGDLAWKTQQEADEAVLAWLKEKVPL